MAVVPAAHIDVVTPTRPVPGELVPPYSAEARLFITTTQAGRELQLMAAEVQSRMDHPSNAARYINTTEFDLVGYTTGVEMQTGRQGRRITITSAIPLSSGVLNGTLIQVEIDQRFTGAEVLLVETCFSAGHPPATLPDPRSLTVTQVYSVIGGQTIPDAAQTRLSSISETNLKTGVRSFDVAADGFTMSEHV